MRSIGTKLAVAAAALVAGLATFTAPASAEAQQSTAAVRQCQAFNVGPDSASVPGDRLDDYFAGVQGGFANEELLCGNGQTYGAVHIELKHNVDNWDVTLECMRNVLDRGTFRAYDGKREWRFQWAPGRSAKVIAGMNGVITAYPEWDSGSAGSWDECGQQ
ncbi:hypothetical protein [Actinokineospora iranica]|uniref:Secreted protein n=1 Tax=Actinokineospora iranica TaxID=1271860 RepID=A0A1G6MDV5_9PSEU|nr:hypothetical protein [Actinokineospora iranica]SDC53631.1 hypothetical protein SAMN05216174_102501 [Actinokineospora iranica]